MRRKTEMTPVSLGCYAQKNGFRAGNIPDSVLIYLLMRAAVL